jgi:hypothetical protein
MCVWAGLPQVAQGNLKMYAVTRCSGEVGHSETAKLPKEQLCRRRTFSDPSTVRFMLCTSLIRCDLVQKYFAVCLPMSHAELFLASHAVVDGVELTAGIARTVVPSPLNHVVELVLYFAGGWIP